MPQTNSPVDIGSRLELFVDDYLVDRLHGTERVLQHPAPQEVSMRFDRPWDGNNPGHVTVFQDGDTYRMYYIASVEVYGGNDGRPHDDLICYAESTDGINWTRPSLGIVEFDGSTDNNIILERYRAYVFAPFKDPNPDATADARYKAVGRDKMWEGLYAHKSADGIHWSLMADEPVITEGAFDSLNLAFWDPIRKEYRDFREDGEPWQGSHTGRDIKTSTTKDFLSWPDPVWLKYSPGRVSELYTNGVQPYYRAPHIFLGFPTRYTDRGWTESTKALPQLDNRELRATMHPRMGTAVTDGMFMSSRDGESFDIWPESFIRPGLKLKENWFYADGYQNKGIVETKSTIEGAANELSFYSTEAMLQPHGIGRLRRYALRIDGFVSVNARMAGGELLTKPLVFEGNELVLNFSTGAAGSIQVELQNEGGYQIEGFAMADCHEVWGDDLARTVKWGETTDVSSLVGQPVRLRFLLKDADLYSMQFKSVGDGSPSRE